MPDIYLADRLQITARAEFRAATTTLNQGRVDSPAGPIILASALYHALLGLAALSVPIEGDLDSERQTLVTIARTLTQQQIREFHSWEMDKIACLDLIHSRAITCMLLPDEFLRDIFHNTIAFVDTLTGELYRLVEQAKDDPE